MSAPTTRQRIEAACSARDEAKQRLEAQRIRLAFDAALYAAREESGLLSTEQFRNSVQSWLRQCHTNQLDPFAALSEEPKR